VQSTLSGITAMAKPDLDDRIWARIEKKEAIKAQIRRDIEARIAGKPRAQARMTAKARWDAAIATALVNTNGDRGRAVMAVNREIPGLREAMVREVNAGRQAQPTASRAT